MKSYDIVIVLQGKCPKLHFPEKKSLLMKNHNTVQTL